MRSFLRDRDNDVTAQITRPSVSANHISLTTHSPTPRQPCFCRRLDHRQTSLTRSRKSSSFLRDALQYFTGALQAVWLLQPWQMLTSTPQRASTWYAQEKLLMMSHHRSHLGCPSAVVRIHRMTWTRRVRSARCCRALLWRLLPPHCVRQLRTNPKD
jgi:hypothetical protein